MRIIQLFVVGLVATQLVACADTREAFRATLARRTAYVDRNLLQAFPCIADGIRTTFPVPYEDNPSYAQLQLSGFEAVKHVLTVTLTPESAGIPADETRTIVYEFFDGGRDRTGIHYGVETAGANRESWWEQAYQPLAGCGAIRKP